MMVHEKNRRVSLYDQELYHPQDFFCTLATTPGSQNTTGRSVLSRRFLYFCWDLLAWISSGPDLSSTEFDTSTREMLLSVQSSFSSLNFIFRR